MMKGNTLTLPVCNATVRGFDGSGVVVELHSGPEWAHRKTVTLTANNRMQLDTRGKRGKPQIGNVPASPHSVRPAVGNTVIVRIAGGPMSIEPERWSLVDEKMTGRPPTEQRYYTGTGTHR